MNKPAHALACLLLAVCAPLHPARASDRATARTPMTQTTDARTPVALPAKLPLPRSGLRLARRAQAGSFYDVIGRRAAAYGYEGRGMEVWAHPLKLVDDLRLSFAIEGYPQEFRAADLLTHIDVRPEATTFTYAHAAFTVREIVFAPVDEPGVVVLLDVDSVLPITVRVSFRPRLSLA